MSDFAKADGAKIQVIFDRDLVGDVTGNESHFTVIVPEYNYVPNGIIQNVTHTVASVVAGDNAKTIVLNMVATQRFESAAGDIIVTYDGLGTLAGAGGAVEAFSQSFAPDDLIAKPDQNETEHISLNSVVPTGVLTEIRYFSAKCMEHMELLSVSATAVLTHVDDI